MIRIKRIVFGVLLLTLLPAHQSEDTVKVESPEIPKIVVIEEPKIKPIVEVPGDFSAKVEAGFKWAHVYRRAVEDFNQDLDVEKMTAGLIALGAVETGHQPWLIGDSGKSVSIFQFRCLDTEREIRQGERPFHHSGYRELLRLYFGMDFKCSDILTTEEAFSQMSQEEKESLIYKQATAALVVLETVAEGLHRRGGADWISDVNWTHLATRWNRPISPRIARQLSGKATDADREMLDNDHLFKYYKTFVVCYNRTLKVRSSGLL